MLDIIDQLSTYYRLTLCSLSAKFLYVTNLIQIYRKKLCIMNCNFREYYVEIMERMCYNLLNYSITIIMPSY